MCHMIQVYVNRPLSHNPCNDLGLARGRQEPTLKSRVSSYLELPNRDKHSSQGKGSAVNLSNPGGTLQAED